MLQLHGAGLFGHCRDSSKLIVLLYVVVLLIVVYWIRYIYIYRVVCTIVVNYCATGEFVIKHYPVIIIIVMHVMYY